MSRFCLESVADAASECKSMPVKVVTARSHYFLHRIVLVRAVWVGGPALPLRLVALAALLFFLLRALDLGSDCSRDQLRIGSFPKRMRGVCFLH